MHAILKTGFIACVSFYKLAMNIKTANLTNYHSHCLYCDGRASMEEFVRFAISEGFSAYGFSSHAPLPFPTAWTMEWDCVDDYLAEFHRLKVKYARDIELYIGLEIDYLNEDSNPASIRLGNIPLDYRIGSVHLLYNDVGEVVDVDVPAEKFHAIVDEQFHGDLVRVVRLYYSRLMRMMELGGFEILGHADKIHYNAQCYRPNLLHEPWYEKLVNDYMNLVVEKNYMLEINTKAYQKLGTFYPNERYFSTLRKRRIKVLVNSDAHYPDCINNGRPQALSALRESGYDTVMELHHGLWESTPIE